MDADNTLEEGEILDNDDYIPQDRPSNYLSMLEPRFPIVEEVESDDDFASSSDTDTDSDNKSKRIKQPKLKLKPKACHSKGTRLKKYDIWSTRIQEDALLENLVNCDVSNVDRSRNVETYPLPSYITPRKTNKRTHDDRNKSDIRLNKRSERYSEHHNTSTVSRTILDMHATIDNSEEDIARDIANKLFEEKEDLIRMVVEIAGKSKALELFKETKRIEENGGMLIMNETRRRTPGGVFLFLVRHDNNITREQQIKIFDEERLNYKKIVRTKRKQKLQQIKQKIAASKQTLPELLTSAELCAQNLKDKDRTRRKSEEIDVKNPPPSPVTDGHENSMDGMENINKEENIIEINQMINSTDRNIISYEDDYIDNAVEMDLF